MSPGPPSIQTMHAAFDIIETAVDVVRQNRENDTNIFNAIRSACHGNPELLQDLKVSDIVSITCGCTHSSSNVNERHIEMVRLCEKFLPRRPPAPHWADVSLYDAYIQRPDLFKFDIHSKYMNYTGNTHTRDDCLYPDHSGCVENRGVYEPNRKKMCANWSPYHVPLP